MSHKILRSTQQNNEPDFLSILKARLKTKSVEVDEDNLIVKEVKRLWDEKMGTKTKALPANPAPFFQTRYLGLVGGNQPKTKETGRNSQIPDFLKPVVGRNH